MSNEVIRSKPRISSDIPNAKAIVSSPPTPIKNQSPHSKSSCVDCIQDAILDDAYRLKLLQLCKQESPQPFESAFSKEIYTEVERFDSGTYAEVFKANHKQSGRQIVFKVVRCVPKVLKKKLKKINFHGCTNFEDLYNEVLITKELSNLHAKNSWPHSAHSFPREHAVKMVSGGLPAHFQCNLAPAPNSTLSPLRKEPFRRHHGAPIEHVVIAMKHYGDPMWKVIKEKRVDEWQLMSIVKQITFGLAAAELAYEFEHRDLHISNVLVKTTNKRFATFLINAQPYHIETCGVRAIIIDTTFSRFTYDSRGYYKDMTEILKSTTSTPTTKQTLQDHIYVRMVEETGNSWKAFRPKTNALWLYYLYKTLHKSRIMRNSSKAGPMKMFEDALALLRHCSSAADLVHSLVDVDDS